MTPSDKDLSQITCLVSDNGLFVELAMTLARTYKKVYYWVPSTSGFPRMNNAWIGKGIKEIEVVADVFGPHFDQVDLFVFPDVGFGPLQEQLRKMNKRVFGSGMGEDMELDRVLCKKKMAEQGLPVGPYKSVHGIPALREHLKAHKNQHVKISRYRGSFETFKSEHYAMVEPKIDEVEANMGAFKHEADFVCEDDLPDKFEIGSDMYCVDGQFPTKTLAGPEIKDEGFVGVFKSRSEFPKELTRFDQVMAPIFKKYGYRGFYSTEVRIGKDKVPYMIDFCGRAASPPNELYQEFYRNLADILWQAAGGVCIDPIPVAKYGAEALIHSSWASDKWQPLDIPDNIKQYVKLRNITKIKGRYYCIPQPPSELPEIGAVIGFGDSLEAAVDMVREVAEGVKGYYVEIKLDAFERADEEIAKGEEYGIRMFS